MIDKLSLQFLTDGNGHKRAVLIPIEEWQDLQAELRLLNEFKQMKASLTEGFREMKGIRRGKLNRTSLNSFLDEC